MSSRTIVEKGKVRFFDFKFVQHADKNLPDRRIPWTKHQYVLVSFCEKMPEYASLLWTSIITSTLISASST